MYTKLTNRTRAGALEAVLVLALALVLSACGGVDDGSTAVSITVRPQTVIAGAQQNNNPANGIPTDPTRVPQLYEATATALPPQPTTAPAQNPAPTAANPATVGATAGAAATTAASSGATSTAGGANAAPAVSGDAAAGAQLFNATQPACSACHSQGGKVKGIGPALINSKRDDAYILNQLKVGKGAMPAYPALSDAERNNLLAYIRSIK